MPRDDHPDYRDCNDEDCPRFPCRLYREGWRDCWPVAFDAGVDEGYSKGYADGFPDGMAACPGPHTGG